MKRNWNNTFAVRLTNALEASGITQKQLADLTGVTQVSVSRYINGDRIPRAPLAAKMADVLGVTCDYLCGNNTRQCKIGNDDLVSRQAVIDAIRGDGPPEPHYPSWYIDKIKSVPPVSLSEAQETQKGD